MAQNHSDSPRLSADGEMTAGFPDDGRVKFRPKDVGITSAQVWEYDAATSRVSRDVVGETVRALAAPDDFPPIDAAVVPGDRVALAVDPNVPNVDEVVAGAIKVVEATPAEHIDIVLWEEATPRTIEKITAVAGAHPVICHTSDHRESLCYLAADTDAEPIYLNRTLVDADFVLPIVAVRPCNVSQRRDLTGIFPALSDSATRARFARRLEAGADAMPAMKSGNTIAEEVPWLLGVQLLVCVTANSSGQAGEIRAGTIEAIAKRIQPTLRRPDPVPPPASLVVAALDGDVQQQTWENVARAADAALAYAEPDATIVIWSSLEEPPEGALLLLEGVIEAESSIDAGLEGLSSTINESEPLPRWDRFGALAQALARVARKHRLMLHSKLDRETIEPLGIGVVDSASELANLSRNYESCGVLRAASFAGSN